MLMAYDDKSAYALCVFSLALGPNVEPITFVGKTPVFFISFTMFLRLILYVLITHINAFVGFL